MICENTLRDRHSENLKTFLIPVQNQNQNHNQNILRRRQWLLTLHFSNGTHPSECPCSNGSWCKVGTSRMIPLKKVFPENWIANSTFTSLERCPMCQNTESQKSSLFVMSQRAAVISLWFAITSPRQVLAPPLWGLLLFVTFPNIWKVQQSSKFSRRLQTKG